MEKIIVVIVLSILSFTAKAQGPGIQSCAVAGGGYDAACLYVIQRQSLGVPGPQAYTESQERRLQEREASYVMNLDAALTTCNRMPRTIDMLSCRDKAEAVHAQQVEAEQRDRMVMLMMASNWTNPITREAIRSMATRDPILKAALLATERREVLEMFQAEQKPTK